MSVTVSPETMVARWESADRPLFKGKLIDADGCCCAQGDVLRLAGWSDGDLLRADQAEADREVARVLGISRAHAVLLRVVNDRADGCPQDVLRAPEKVLGPEARRVLAFWRRLDAMSHDDWRARAAAWDAARAAAWDAARAAAGAAAGAAAWDAAGATWEVQGASRLTSFVFLPLFGVASPAELDAGAEGGAE